MANGQYILSKYKEELQGDNFLFQVADTRLGNDAIPHIVTGEQAEGFARNGHYDIELFGPNPTSREALAKEAREAIKKEFSNFEMPKSVTEQKEALEAENAALKAKLAELEAAQVKGKKNKEGDVA